MANLNVLKAHLEELLQIAEWKPTAVELEEIARRLRAVTPQNSGEVLDVVNSVCPPTLFKSFEGVDHSDLRALLALALAAAKR